MASPLSQDRTQAPTVQISPPCTPAQTVADVPLSFSAISSSSGAIPPMISTAIWDFAGANPSLDSSRAGPADLSLQVAVQQANMHAMSQPSPRMYTHQNVVLPFAPSRSSRPFPDLPRITHTHPSSVTNNDSHPESQEPRRETTVSLFVIGRRNWLRLYRVMHFARHLYNHRVRWLSTPMVTRKRTPLIGSRNEVGETMTAVSVIITHSLQ